MISAVGWLRRASRSGRRQGRQIVPGPSSLKFHMANLWRTARFTEQWRRVLRSVLYDKVYRHGPRPRQPLRGSPHRGPLV